MLLKPDKGVSQQYQKRVPGPQELSGGQVGAGRSVRFPGFSSLPVPAWLPARSPVPGEPRCLLQPSPGVCESWFQSPGVGRCANRR